MDPLVRIIGVAILFAILFALIGFLKDYFKFNRIKNNLDKVKKNCESGSAKDCFDLAEFYNIKEKDLDKSAEYHQKSCDLNNEVSCHVLEAWYDKGKIIKKNNH